MDLKYIPIFEETAFSLFLGAYNGDIPVHVRWFLSLQNLHIDFKTYIILNIVKFSYLGGYLNRTWHVLFTCSIRWAIMP